VQDDRILRLVGRVERAADTTVGSRRTEFLPARQRAPSDTRCAAPKKATVPFSGPRIRFRFSAQQNETAQIVALELKEISLDLLP
jgi:hypothetical protein